MFNIRQKATIPLVKMTMDRPHGNRQTQERHPEVCGEQEETWEGAEQAEVTTEVWGQAKSPGLGTAAQKGEGQRWEGRGGRATGPADSAPTSARQERKLVILPRLSVL